MNRLTTFVLRHRVLVGLFWLAMMVAGAATAGNVGDRLSYDFSLPGQEGYETEAALIESYGSTATVGYIPVVTVGPDTTVEQSRPAVDAVFDAVRAIDGLRVADLASTGDEAFVTADGRSAFGIVYAPPAAGFVDPYSEQVEAAVAAAAAQGDVTVTVTGYNQLAAGSSDGGEGPDVLAETLLGALGALAVLLFVFASVLALVPLVIAAVAILSTFLIVLGLTTFADVSFVVQFLISLVGLGVAIDYSLLVVSRWREERSHGRSNEEAIRIAMRTAGGSVVASGVTVAISLVALVVIPVPLLQSMGYGGMLIPLISTAVVLTLLPAMLSAIGPRLDWPRIRKESTASPAWSAWARLVVRRRWIAAGVALVALGVLIAPTTMTQFGIASTSSLARSGAAVDAMALLAAGGVESGVTTPIVVLADDETAALAVADAAGEVPGIRSVSIAEPGIDGRVAVDVIPNAETVDSSSVAVVDDVAAATSDLPGYVGTAGAGATITDYRRAVYDNFPYVIALIALITFILLARTFRSLLLPFKAVVLNLLSLGAVFGAATWFWQEGNGSSLIFDISATGAMAFWIPPLIFAFLFGLSMDYEVFILARMREEYDATGSTTTAIVEGIGRTGRLVTSAALILFFSFAALASAPGTDIKVFATALGVGILLDATIVRALLVPALVSLFGRWNWWLPNWAARLLFVAPSPVGPRQPRVTTAPPAIEDRVLDPV